MHLYLLTRGIKHDVDRFIRELSSKYVPYKFHGKDLMLQVAVRPVQFWEIVFPSENKDLMLNTIFTGTGDGKGSPHIKRFEKYIKWIRRLLGKEVKPIPEFPVGLGIPCYKENIEMIGIGVKDDVITTEEIKTEML